MGNFSRDPLQELLDNRDRGYLGLHVEQGVPVLDRDLNLLQDLVTSTVREVFARHIGNGLDRQDSAFQIEGIPADNDFRILAPAGGGACLVGGIRIRIDASTLYSAQDGVAALTSPTALQPDPREDIVYLDVWVEEIDSADDPTLENIADIGTQTSVRLRPTWRVRVSEGGAAPAPDPGHIHYPIARLTRPRAVSEIRPGMVEDLRNTGLNLSELQERVRMMEQLIFFPSFADAGGSQFAPMVGSPGDPVMLRGNNLHVGTSRVFFGGVEAELTAPPEEGELHVRVPLGAGGPVTIRVVTSAGEVTSDDTFAVLAGGGDPDDLPEFSAPGSQFVPAIGAPGDLITLSGLNFDHPPVVVRFGPAPAEVVGVPSATEITARVPAGLAPGPVRITVDTDVGRVTTDDNFGVLAVGVNTPAFGPSGGGQISPMVGSVGNPVTLTGTNFDQPGLTVEFVSQAVGGPTVLAAISGAPTATEIVVTVPAGLPVGSTRIRVTTAAGTVTSNDAFSLLP